MKVTIKYFGLIADITNKKEEVLTLNDNLLKTESLVNNLVQKYDDLSSSPFVVAVNQKVVTENLTLKNNDTIALLPPFAGG